MNDYLSQVDGTDTKSAKKRVAAIGKWMPIHKGHKKFLVDFAKNSDVEELIIMIGSCYERSEVRYSITANEREKMIRAVMKREGVPEEKYKIIPVSDYPTFDEWILKVLEVCKNNGVTHFCTGNKEDILDVLERNEMDLGMELINPETDSDFPYHATDIRNMIIRGEYDKVKELIPDEVQPVLFKYTFKEILAASQDRNIDFIGGRQTVDIILLVKDANDGIVYALVGKRPKDKKDFPGFLALPGSAINEFETATNAAIRTLYEETGLQLKMLDNSLEPAIVRFEGVERPSLEQLYVNGIYGTFDESKNGTKGGSSQCFTIFIEGDVNEYRRLLKLKDGLLDVNFIDVKKVVNEQLAFEHNDMLNKAINMFEAYPRLHRNF